MGSVNSSGKKYRTSYNEFSYVHQYLQLTISPIAVFENGEIYKIEDIIYEAVRGEVSFHRNGRYNIVPDNRTRTGVIKFRYSLIGWC